MDTITVAAHLFFPFFFFSVIFFQQRWVRYTLGRADKENKIPLTEVTWLHWPLQLQKQTICSTTSVPEAAWRGVAAVLHTATCHTSKPQNQQRAFLPWLFSLCLRHYILPNRSASPAKYKALFKWQRLQKYLCHLLSYHLCPTDCWPSHGWSPCCPAVNKLIPRPSFSNSMTATRV